jgi:hypothetical protein
LVEQMRRARRIGERMLLMRAMMATVSPSVLEELLHTGALRECNRWLVEGKQEQQTTLLAHLLQVRVILQQTRLVLHQIRVVLHQIRVVLCQIHLVLHHTEYMFGFSSNSHAAGALVAGAEVQSYNRCVWFYNRCF